MFSAQTAPIYRGQKCMKCQPGLHFQQYSYYPKLIQKSELGNYIKYHLYNKAALQWRWMLRDPCSDCHVLEFDFKWASYDSLLCGAFSTSATFSSYWLRRLFIISSTSSFDAFTADNSSFSCLISFSNSWRRQAFKISIFSHSESLTPVALCNKCNKKYRNK